MHKLCIRPYQLYVLLQETDQLCFDAFGVQNILDLSAISCLLNSSCSGIPSANMTANLAGQDRCVHGNRLDISVLFWVPPEVRCAISASGTAKAHYAWATYKQKYGGIRHGVCSAADLEEGDERDGAVRTYLITHVT